jgi:magnesium transporter
LSIQAQEELVQALGQEELVSILNEMAPDDRTALLEDLPAPVVTRLLKLLAPRQRAVAQTLLNYPEGTVGRLMTPDFIAIRDQWTVQQVLDHVRAVGSDTESLNVLYVIDEQGRLLDEVRIREFLLRPLTARVKDLHDASFVGLRVTDQQKEVVQVFRKYDRTMLPVVDSRGILVGVVTVDDVLDLAEREATVEFQRMGGMETLEAPYLKTSLASMIRKRATWLSALFLGETLTASAMGYFEGEIEKAVVLSLFIPLIISSGGNSGSQATSLIIRSLAVGDVALRDWWRVFCRELAAGLGLGAVLAAVGSGRILLWQELGWKDYGQHYVLIALTVSCSLVGVVLFGSLAGAMLPFILRRLGLDPAVSSAPFVATLVDVTGLIIYFTVAYLFLHGTLL